VMQLGREASAPSIDTEKHLRSYIARLISPRS
jgi:hypothetical protein